VKRVLLGDIGATNARFALASNGALGEVRSFEVAEYPRFIDALAIFLEEVSSSITHAVIAVAGPVVEQRAKLTNQAWTIDADELESTFGLRARIINDFQAVALSLPLLRSEDLVGIGGGKIEEGTPKAVLGPGTGLGVACLANSSIPSRAVSRSLGCMVQNMSLTKSASRTVFSSLIRAPAEVKVRLMLRRSDLLRLRVR